MPKMMDKKHKNKVEKVMHEFKVGTLHSGSSKGPKVTNHDQAMAIAMSEQRKAEGKSPKKGNPHEDAYRKKYRGK